MKRVLESGWAMLVIHLAVFALLIIGAIVLFGLPLLVSVACILTWMVLSIQLGKPFGSAVPKNAVNKARGGVFFTKVEAGTARVVKFLGQPIRVCWQYDGYVELDNGLIIRKEELYQHPQCHEYQKFPSKGAGVKRKQAVYYKRPITHRGLRKEFYVDMVHEFTLRVNGKTEIIKHHIRKNLGHKEVFYEMEGVILDVVKIQQIIDFHTKRRADLEAGRRLPEFEASVETFKKSKGWVETQDVPLQIFNVIGPDFWHVAVKTLKGEFYFVQAIPANLHPDPTEDKEIRVKLDIEAIVWERLVFQGERATVKHIDAGSGRLAGGVFFVGLWPLFQLHNFHLTWTSLETSEEGIEGKNKPKTRSELTDTVFIKDDVYYALLSQAEDSDLMRLDLELLIKLRVNNPILTLFRIEKWLENITLIALANYREMVSEAQFNEIIKSKKRYGATWLTLFFTTIYDPKGEDVWRRYGLHILTVELRNVTPAGVEAAELAKIQAAKWIAMRNKEATIENADAEVQRIKRVFTTIQEYGDLGQLLRYFETIEKAANGAGSTIIPFGSLESVIGGLVHGRGNSSQQDELAKLLLKNNITADRLKTILELVKS